jgi:predicted transcriptional regulator
MPRAKIIPKMGSNGFTVLEQRRIECGLTAVALAREAGVSRNVIWKLESRADRLNPRPDTIAKIVSALNRKQSDIGGQSLDFGDLFETAKSR